MPSQDPQNQKEGIESVSDADRFARLGEMGAKANDADESGTLADQGDKALHNINVAGDTHEPQDHIDYLNTGRTGRPIEKEVSSNPATSQMVSLLASLPLPHLQQLIDDMSAPLRPVLGSDSPDSLTDKPVTDIFARWQEAKVEIFTFLLINRRILQGISSTQCELATATAQAAKCEQNELKTVVEECLERIKKSQAENSVAQEQLLKLRHVHSGVLGGDLNDAIQKSKTTEKELAKAEKDAKAYTQALDKHTQDAESAEADVARLKKNHQGISRDVSETERAVRVLSTVNMFFKFGLDRAVVALEEDFGDMKAWIEGKIAAGGGDGGSAASGGDQDVLQSS
ncbi:hypothetical protein FALBO_7174 [Fusarium albosuccineum]|uniref:Uncharacterized protein n=1 Tax=Fusarium albosuccineum TaxID=1237068 RepID=A0A8H4LBY4_9HYPO|nr:hypothetical protein FALBO_7174 [Fusarium albosuccineum]